MLGPHKVQETFIKSIMSPENKLVQDAHAGQVIGVCLSNLTKWHMKIGDVISDPSGGEPARAAKRVLAQVTVMMTPIHLKQGFEAILHCRTAHVRCRLVAIVAKLDKRGNPVEHQPEKLTQGDTALVELAPEQAICLEPFSEIPSFGRIVLRDSSYQ